MTEASRKEDATGVAEAEVSEERSLRLEGPAAEVLGVDLSGAKMEDLSEEKLRRLDAAATERPWLAGIRKTCSCPRPEQHSCLIDGNNTTTLLSAFGYNNPKAAHDVELLTSLRNAVPELVALIEAARSYVNVGAELEEIRRASKGPSPKGSVLARAIVIIATVDNREEALRKALASLDARVSGRTSVEGVDGISAAEPARPALALRTGTSPQPTPSGNIMLYMQGAAFRCEECKSNVFSKLEAKKTDLPGTDRYVCNGCGAFYVAHAEKNASITP